MIVLFRPHDRRVLRLEPEVWTDQEGMQRRIPDQFIPGPMYALTLSEDLNTLVFEPTLVPDVGAETILRRMDHLPTQETLDGAAQGIARHLAEATQRILAVLQPGPVPEPEEPEAEGLLERWVSIWTAIWVMPWERWVLVGLAVLRNCLVVMTSWPWLPSWSVRLLTLLLAVAMAILSADFIEHYLLKMIFGRAYLPGLRAKGELEGYTGASDRNVPSWRALVFGADTWRPPWD